MEGVRPRSVEVSIALVDDATIQRLNAEYRGKDAPTDVLSFTQEAEVTVPGAPKLLGDVVVSLDTAAKQAATGGRSLDDEAAQLVIHSVLHLLGYDDVTVEGYAEMVRKGEEVWQRIQTDTPRAKR
ncbi:MAG: rRNA maturation RNase YbeY [Armatimonadota bacterium]